MSYKQVDNALARKRDRNAEDSRSHRRMINDGFEMLRAQLGLPTRASKTTTLFRAVAVLSKTVRTTTLRPPEDTGQRLDGDEMERLITTCLNVVGDKLPLLPAFKEVMDGSPFMYPLRAWRSIAGIDTLEDKVLGCLPSEKAEYCQHITLALLAAEARGIGYNPVAARNSALEDKDNNDDSDDELLALSQNF